MRRQLATLQGQSDAERLGVPSSAAADEVRRAFLALAKQWHPNRFGLERPEVRAAAEEIFILLSRAHENLLRAGQQASAPAPRASPSPRPQVGGPPARGPSSTPPAPGRAPLPPRPVGAAPLTGPSALRPPPLQTPPPTTTAPRVARPAVATPAPRPAQRPPTVDEDEDVTAGRRLLASFDLARALARFDRALGRHADAPLILSLREVTKARQLHQAGKTAEASHLLDQARQRTPSCPEVLEAVEQLRGDKPKSEKGGFLRRFLWED